MLPLVHINLTACFGCLQRCPGRTCSRLLLTPQKEENAWTVSVHKVERSKLEALMPSSLLLFNSQISFSLHFQEPEALEGSGKQRGGQGLPRVPASRAVAFPSPPLWSWLRWITSRSKGRIEKAVQDHVFSLGCLKNQIFTYNSM